MARTSRSRLQRGSRKTRLQEALAEVVGPFPYGSAEVHPLRVWKYIAKLGERFGHDVKFEFVREIGEALKRRIENRYFPDERAMRVIMFPEDVFGHKEHGYEVGALCSDVIGHIGAKGTVQIAICEFLFYHCQGRSFDAIEAASRALIELERTRRTEETEIVGIVWNIEAAALKRALLAKAKV